MIYAHCLRCVRYTHSSSSTAVQMTAGMIWAVPSQELKIAAAFLHRETGRRGHSPEEGVRCGHSVEAEFEQSSRHKQFVAVQWSGTRGSAFSGGQEVLGRQESESWLGEGRPGWSKHVGSIGDFGQTFPVREVGRYQKEAAEESGGYCKLGSGQVAARYIGAVSTDRFLCLFWHDSM
jgi:hypothetical protein